MNWTKADKPHPKKTQTLSSILNLNGAHSKNSLFSNLAKNKYNRNASNFDSDSSESESLEEKSKKSQDSGKISLKDLCDEDKLRIANLVKELAKISEEKTKVEKSLEEERKQKDSEIKEILKQQESLLNDKETLLNKFSKVQQKLDHLKRRSKLENKKSKDLLVKNNEGNSLPPKPQKNSPDNKNVDPFSPFKSSTPKNLSPRSISPINGFNAKLLNNQNDDLSEDQSRSCILNDRHSEDLKKIELIKQRMELMEEQKKLSQLLEQQEEMLKEKQSQIILQQKIHRERLEEIAKQKAENQSMHEINQHIETNDVDFIMQSQQQNELLKAYLMNNRPVFEHINPKISQSPYLKIPMIQALPETMKNNESPAKEQTNTVNLESLASLVYEKLLLKKSAEAHQANIKNPIQSLSERDDASINNASLASSKQENEKYLIDLILDQNEANDKDKNKNFRIKPLSARLDSKYFMSSQVQDLEESKLIEELFFI